MALAFRRAMSEADAAAAKEAPSFRNNHGFKDIEKPLVFDWDSAKAVAGDSALAWKATEPLPKSAVMATAVTQGITKLSGPVHCVGNKGDQVAKQKEAAFEIMRRQIKQIVVHFGEDATVPEQRALVGKYEVKDGVLHMVVSFNLSKPYGGNIDFPKDDTWVWQYLDDSENISFELLRNAIANDKSNSYGVNSNIKAFVKDKLGKELPIEVNYDDIKATPGRTVDAVGQPPSKNNKLLLQALNERASSTVRHSLDKVFKDALGKEAFAETFTAIAVRMVAADAHSVSVEKEGKKLVYKFAVKLADAQNANRAWNDGEVGTKIVNLL